MRRTQVVDNANSRGMMLTLAIALASGSATAQSDKRRALRTIANKTVTSSTEKN